MNPLVFKLVRITAFALTGFFTAKIFIKYFKGKNKSFTMSDPEIIAIAVFFGAIFSGFLSFLIKAFFNN
ncbi:MAG: hypothetical protein WDA74_06145 [Spirochaetota bacterium]